VSQICQDVGNKNEFAQATNSESEVLSWRRKRTAWVYSTNVRRGAAFPISISISFNCKKEEDKQDEEVVPILRFNFITLIAWLYWKLSHKLSKEFLSMGQSFDINVLEKANKNWSYKRKKKLFGSWGKQGFIFFPRYKDRVLYLADFFAEFNKNANRRQTCLRIFLMRSAVTRWISNCL